MLFSMIEPVMLLTGDAIDSNDNSLSTLNSNHVEDLLIVKIQ